MQVLHQLDVLHVLAGDLRQRDIEHIQVLAPDQVQQQIERALEGIQEHLERLRRYVQVLRQLRERLAIDHGERHLDLFGHGLRHHGQRLRRG